MDYARRVCSFLPLARDVVASPRSSGRRTPKLRSAKKMLYRGAFVAVSLIVTSCSTLTTVPVRSATSGHGLLVSVAVNRIPATFLLDTGATNTVLSSQFASRMNVESEALPFDMPIETASRQPLVGARYVPLRSFQLGPIRAKRNSGEALIVDLSNVRKLTKEDVDGLVGNSTLGSADYILNVHKPSLKVARTISLPDYGQAARLSVSGHRTYLPVSVNGRTFDFLLDTGSTRSFVSLEVLQQLEGIDVKSLQLESVSVNAVDIGKFDSFTAAASLGEVFIPKFSFLVGDRNLIGLDLLRHGELLVSVKQGRFVFRNVTIRVGWGACAQSSL